MGKALGGWSGGEAHDDGGPHRELAVLVVRPLLDPDGSAIAVLRWGLLRHLGLDVEGVADRVAVSDLAVRTLDEAAGRALCVAPTGHRPALAALPAHASHRLRRR